MLTVESLVFLWMSFTNDAFTITYFLYDNTVIIIMSIGINNLCGPWYEFYFIPFIKINHIIINKFCLYSCFDVYMIVPYYLCF